MPCVKIIAFAKKNIVMLVAALAALITCFFVPVDGERGKNMA